MKTRGILLLVILLGQLGTPAWANDLLETINRPTLKGGVTVSKFLPRAMYGTWSITATVLETTAPVAMFYPSKNELWTLNRDDSGITLQNIVTQAAASITVDEVQGNTATFHHTGTLSRNMKIIETPTITVNGNQLSGVNRQTILVERGGKVVQQYNLLIQVEGDRIAGPKFSFRDPEEAGGPQLEVEPLQVKQ